VTTGDTDLAVVGAGILGLAVAAAAEYVPELAATSALALARLIADGGEPRLG
jgi:threonine dehydrogenase-like Zn-dependent dehydrogenase